MTDNTNRPARYFALCVSARRAALGAPLEAAGASVTFFDDASELVARAAVDPPSGVLVELVTTVKIGFARMEPLRRLVVGWPVLTCKVHPNGHVLAIGARPTRSAPLPTVLAELAEDPYAWTLPTHRRKFIRVKLDARARVQIDGESGPPRNGNIANLSIAGAFIIQGDPVAPGTGMQLELWDIGAEAITVRGRAIWRRQWEDGRALPGFGVAFDQAVDDPPIVRAIVRRV